MGLRLAFNAIFIDQFNGGKQRPFLYINGQNARKPDSALEGEDIRLILPGGASKTWSTI
jgi:hypothetical protein